MYISPRIISYLLVFMALLLFLKLLRDRKGAVERFYKAFRQLYWRWKNSLLNCRRAAAKTSREESMQLATVTSETAQKIDFSSELNQAQLEAVLHDKGPMLIVAGAGSGKTRTLVYRVAKLVHSGVPSERILLLTFTRKASQEMIGRATKLLDSRCGNIAGGTFHSFAAKQLRQYGSILGFADNFTIYDRADTETLIGKERESLLKEIEGVAGAKPKNFPSRTLLASIFSRAVNRDETISHALEQEAPGACKYAMEVSYLQERYTKSKLEKNAMDYDDLLVFLLALMKDNPAVQQNIAKKFDHILVDEYQDTNHIQAKILRLLACTHTNVVVVGDDSQSIYGFRGARHKNILEFARVFKGAKIVKLEENYRSCQPILSMSNAVMLKAKEKIEKKLIAIRKGGRLPEVYSTDSEFDQAQFIANNIQIMAKQYGVPLKDIAVLFRYGYMADVMEIVLSKIKIPYRKYGGVRFLECQHVKDILSFLRFAGNPLDAVSLKRILMMAEGVGAKTAENTIKAVTAVARKNSKQEILTAVKSSGKPGVAKITELLAEIDGKTPVDALNEVYKFYDPILEKDFEENDRKWRRDHLEQILDIASVYPTLDAFLIDVALDPPSEENHSGDSTPNDYLTLSTIHSAKGLEWPCVFIIWMLDGKMPSARAGITTAEIEEERRLFYVATTRAKDSLFMTYPSGVMDRFSGQFLSEVSPFIREIPGSLLRFGEALPDTVIPRG